MPAPDIAPMLATGGAVPTNLAGWVAEPKVDGWRARITVDERGVRIHTRTGRLLTVGVDHLHCLTRLDMPVALDGELAVGAGAGDDFARMAAAFGRRSTTRVTFWAFDLTWVDGTHLSDAPYTERRAALEALHLEHLGASIRVVPTFEADQVPDAYRHCDRLGMEGLVLKELTSRYLPGRRSTQWRKLKTPTWASRHAPHRVPDRARPRHTTQA